jgi:hypothetical protein
MGKYITEYFLYRWRYVLGYGVIALSILGLLVVAGLYIPGGVSNAEMQSVVASDALTLKSFDPASIVNLPYHLFQRASIELLGISQFSIKLPSLILGAFSALGMIILLRAWFRHNVAIIATGLTITTGQFLFIAQNGAPGIMYVFLSVWLLVAAMMVARHARFNVLWKLALFAVASISLYTPLSIYILLAIVSAVILHPHLRYILRRLSKPQLLGASAIGLVLLAPLGYAAFKSPSIGLLLLGIPAEWPNLLENGVRFLKQYFDFVTPSSSSFMTPVYGLGSMILILLGILNLFTTKYTARSYMISAWIILLLPILIINPQYTSVTFVPVLLLMAMGIHTLLRNWYQLFPRNPYARIAGLLPLAVLIGGMIVSGVGRYTYGYLYDPQVASNFSKDLGLLNRQLDEPERGETTIVVSSAALPFYSVVAKYHPNLTATTAVDPASKTSIVSRDAPLPQKVADPYRIITSGSSNQSDRFYIYKSDTK